MTKLEFMKELESLLLDIPLEEREDTLKYYNDYFEDAGEDHEEEIIAELGSPKRVADIIKADLNSNAIDRENRGYFTEKGYQDNLNSNYKLEVVGAKEKQTNSAGTERTSTNSTYINNAYTDNGYTGNSNTNNTGSTSGNTNNYYQNTGYNQQANTNQNTGYNSYNGQRSGSTYQGQNNTHTKNTNIGLIILICIFAIPVGLPLLFSAFGIVVGIVGAIFGIVIGFGACGIAMIVAGIVLFVSGIVQMGMPLIGLAFCGAGLLVFGMGMLFAMVCGALCTKVLPTFIRGVVNLCRLPFKNRSVMV